MVSPKIIFRACVQERARRSPLPNPQRFERPTGYPANLTSCSIPFEQGISLLIFWSNKLLCQSSTEKHP